MSTRLSKEELSQYLEKEGIAYITNGPLKKDLMKSFKKREKLTFEILLKNKRSYREVFLEVEKILHLDT